MFEHMDVRVRAGPVMASSAGDRASFIRAARDWGVLLFGYFLLDKHRESDSLPRRGTKAVDVDLELELVLALGVDVAIAASTAPRIGASRSTLQQQANQPSAHKPDHRDIIDTLTRPADAASITRRKDASRPSAGSTQAVSENQGFPCASNPSPCPF